MGALSEVADGLDKPLKSQVTQDSWRPSPVFITIA